jgi:hypothetical protein
MVKWLMVIACVAGCGTFEDPNVVIDLRILGMSATPPEQVVDISMTQDPVKLLAQLVPARVCALVADPNFDRKLRYRLTICNLNGGRCDLAAPHAVIASGLVDDPDLTTPEPEICGMIQPDGNLLGVVLSALDADSLHGLGGVFYGAELKIGGENADEALDLYAFKQLVVQPRIPDTRAANTNPTMSGLTVTIDGVDTPVPLARCVDATAPLVVAPSTKVRFTPLEPDGVRETYIIPTLDGMIRTFTESLTYQWVVGNGSLSKGDTGGPRDPFGNPAPLFTDFTSPSEKDLTGDIPMWIIQRDERLGASWVESCIRVQP